MGNTTASSTAEACKEKGMTSNAACRFQGGDSSSSSGGSSGGGGTGGSGGGGDVYRKDHRCFARVVNKSTARNSGWSARGVQGKLLSGSFFSDKLPNNYPRSRALATRSAAARAAAASSRRQRYPSSPPPGMGLVCTRRAEDGPFNPIVLVVTETGIATVATKMTNAGTEA